LTRVRLERRVSRSARSGRRKQRRRSHGCRDLLVYCGSGHCHHGAVMNADWLPDDMPVRSLCPRMVCTKCGMIGADVRPDWGPHVNKRRV
jgi:hypothetical protein